MENLDPVLLIPILVAIAVVSSSVYYFARYFFKEPSQTEMAEPSEQDSLPAETKKSPTDKTTSLRDALTTSRDSLLGRIKSLWGAPKLSGELREELEEILYTSDLSPLVVERLLLAVEAKLEGTVPSYEEIIALLRKEVLLILSEVPLKEPELWLSRAISSGESQSEPETKQMGESQAKQTQVWFVVGVNGAGKTTTLGKLSAKLAAEGKKVLVAAGDTFRAAAASQLSVWTERAQVEIFVGEGHTDPSALAFDACQKGISKGYDFVLIDTAGRLHNHKHLMDELKKMKRVVAKLNPIFPQQTLLVLDANSGQNALIQAREFHEALGVSGVVLTKLDGSAKGGVALGVAQELRLPVVLVGVGEKLSDLRPFSPTEYADSLL